MQAEGGVKMQFPDFADFKQYLQEFEPEINACTQSQKLYQIKSMTPENVAAFASDIAADTLHAAKVTSLWYLTLYHQWLADHFDAAE